MKKDTKYGRVLSAISHFTVFFLIVAFVITCCMLLFLSVMRNTMGLALTRENLATAAKLTFLNVIIISFLLTVIDFIRRKITVEKNIKRIRDAAEKMADGDFSVRIPESHRADDMFSDIIECFNKMAEELSNTETLRTDFIANVSHELKTPLSVMKNYAAMLAAPELPKEKRIEYSKAISEASKRLADLITNILKLNKLENQQIAPLFEVYDLSEQVIECLLNFEDVWERKGIEIETDIDDGITVFSDKEMMTLVWNNLFSNALKFTSEGGRVSVSVKSDGDDASVTVTDTGCGISSDIGSHIFDKFYQGDTSHATEGNGLGLALVKRVVDITESDISVNSEIGAGTSFTVKIRKN